MWIEFNDLSSFIDVVSRYKALKIYSIRESSDYMTVEAIAQTIKNTYVLQLIIDHEKISEIEDILLENDFVKVKLVKSWEG